MPYDLTISSKKKLSALEYHHFQYLLSSECSARVSEFVCAVLEPECRPTRMGTLEPCKRICKCEYPYIARWYRIFLFCCFSQLCWNHVLILLPAQRCWHPLSIVTAIPIQMIGMCARTRADAANVSEMSINVWTLLAFLCSGSNILDYRNGKLKTNLF